MCLIVIGLEDPKEQNTTTMSCVGIRNLVCENVGISAVKGPVRLVVHKAQKKQKNNMFNETPAITTWLLKIIHRTSCEQFNAGTIFFLPNYIGQLRRGKPASSHGRQAS